MFFERVAVIGVGLIGASFAMAIRGEGLCGVISGSGRSKDNLARAQDRGIIDDYSTDPGAACREADLIFLSCPVGSMERIAGDIRDSVKVNAVMTDAGSVKARITSALDALIPPHAFYVGSHPIAGSERSGIDAADGNLFRGNLCIMTPTENTSPHFFDLVRKLWETLGAKVAVMGPEEHDRVYGAVSHLPHIVAYELVNAVAAVNESYLGYAGKGFRDVTRIAASSPEIWRDICMMNRENLVEFLDGFIAGMERVRKGLSSHDDESLVNEFIRAKALREKIA